MLCIMVKVNLCHNYYQLLIIKNKDIYGKHFFFCFINLWQIDKKAEGPGVALGKKLIFFLIFEFTIAFNTHECPQKFQPGSVQPFGRLYEAYSYTNVLFY